MIYNVQNFGAKADGAPATRAIQRAIDECFKNGGGEVAIPAGVYHVGCIRLRTGVTLHLLENAVLMGSVDPKDYVDYINDEVEPISEEERGMTVDTVVKGYTSRSAEPFSRWNNAIIRAYRADNVAIIGEAGSEINGQNCFDELGEEKYRGPHAINMWFCHGVELRGYTIRDSANWAHAIQNSTDIHMSGVTVLGGHDAFDVRTCDRVLVENCVLRSGDDCIAGFDNIDVTVRNCIFDCACSWMRFGGTNVLVENCKGIAPSTYGFRGSLTPEEKAARADTHENCRHTCHNSFLYYCDNRAEVRMTPGNILIRDCEFIQPNAVMNLPFGRLWCTNRSLHDLTFERCSFLGISMTGMLSCPPEEPFHLVMRDCTVTPREGGESVAIFDGVGVGSITLENVTFEGFTEPRIVAPGAEITVIGGTPVTY